MARVQVSVEKFLPVSAETVWAIVGDFGGLATWHPYVPNCELSEDGLVRTIAIPPTPAVERLDAAASGPMLHVYTVDAGPMPMTDYRAEMGVREEEGGALLFYRSTSEPVGVDAAKLEAMLRKFFEAGFQAVAAKLSV